MKRIIFIILKILEVSAVFATYWLIILFGKFLSRFDFFSYGKDVITNLDYFVFGFLGVFGILFLTFIVVLIFIPITKKNWEWSERIYKKIKK